MSYYSQSMNSGGGGSPYYSQNMNGGGVLSPMSPPVGAYSSGGYRLNSGLPPPSSTGARSMGRISPAAFKAAKELGYPNPEVLNECEKTMNSLEVHHCDMHRGVLEWLKNNGAKNKHR